MNEFLLFITSAACVCCMSTKRIKCYERLDRFQITPAFYLMAINILLKLSNLRNLNVSNEYFRRRLIALNNFFYVKTYLEHWIGKYVWFVFMTLKRACVNKLIWAILCHLTHLIQPNIHPKIIIFIRLFKANKCLMRSYNDTLLPMWFVGFYCFINRNCVSL